MLGYLPDFYQNSRVIQQGILQPEGVQFDALQFTLTDILNQFFAQTATWGIDKWESELGIVSDPNKPLFQRRDAVLSQLRGYGTATIGVITQIVRGFDDTALAWEDFAASTVWLRFPNGIDLNIDDMRAMVRKLLPSHLTFVESFGTTVQQPMQFAGSRGVQVSRSTWFNGQNTMILDGTQLLDGSWTLSGGSPSPSMTSTVTVRVNKLVTFAQNTVVSGYFLDGQRPLDGTWNLVGTTTDVRTVGSSMTVSGKAV